MAKKKIVSISYIDDHFKFLEIDKHSSGFIPNKPPKDINLESLIKTCRRADEIYINATFPSALYSWVVLPKIKKKYLNQLIETDAAERLHVTQKLFFESQVIGEILDDRLMKYKVAYIGISEEEIFEIWDNLKEFNHKIKYITPIPVSIASMIANIDHPVQNFIFVWVGLNSTIICVSSPAGVVKVARLVPIGFSFIESDLKDTVTSAEFTKKDFHVGEDYLLNTAKDAPVKSEGFETQSATNVIELDSTFIVEDTQKKDDAPTVTGTGTNTVTQMSLQQDDATFITPDNKTELTLQADDATFITPGNKTELTMQADDATFITPEDKTDITIHDNDSTVIALEKTTEKASQKVTENKEDTFTYTKIDLGSGQVSKKKHTQLDAFSRSMNREIEMTTTFFKQEFREAEPREIYFLGNPSLKNIFDVNPITGVKTGIHYELSENPFEGSVEKLSYENISLAANLYNLEVFNFIPNKEIFARKLNNIFRLAYAMLFVLVVLVSVWGFQLSQIKASSVRTMKELLNNVQPLNDDINKLNNEIRILLPFEGWKKIYQNALENQPRLRNAIFELAKIVPSNVIIDSFKIIKDENNSWKGTINGQLKADGFHDAVTLIRDFGANVNSSGYFKISDLKYNLISDRSANAPVDFQIAISILK